MTLFQQLLLAREKFQTAKTMMDQASEECSRIIARLEREFIGTLPLEADVLFIQEAVAAHYGVSVSVVASTLRTAYIYEVRMVSIALCRQLTTHPQRRLAECFNVATHTSICNAEVALSKRVQTDARFAKTFAELKHSISHRLAEHRAGKSA